MTTTVQKAAALKISSWSATLLIAGTCVGGGMIAMPIQTAEIGFFMAALVLLASWVFMTFTGLLLVEATLWIKQNSHFSSIAQILLGRFGRILSLVVYLFMNSASLVAYTSGGAILIQGWLKILLGISSPYALCCILFTLLFGGFVYLGVSFVGKINNLSTFLMGIFYCYLVGLGLYHLQPDYLVFRPSWGTALKSFPLIFAAFSYQMVVPSICSYLNYDPAKLKKAIFWGTGIPFAIYFLWLLVVHGLIPLEGAGGLQEAYTNGAMIVEPLKQQLPNRFLNPVIDGFAFFALITSYLGLSIALFDFLRDFFKGMSMNPGNHLIAFVSLTPCLFFAILFPRALLSFLDLSGGFGDAILSGLIPISMVWVGRYRHQLNGEYRAPGEKWALALAATFALTIFFVQWMQLFR